MKPAIGADFRGQSGSIVSTRQKSFLRSTDILVIRRSVDAPVL